MKYLIILFFLMLATCASLLLPAHPSERVKRIIDGDTVVTTRFGKIRLYGMDAPEKRQPLGPAATEHLRKLIGDERVECIRIGSAFTYNCRVCILVIESGVSLNREMVKAGYAYDEPRYSKGFYKQTETEAHEASLGVLASPDSVKPWV